MLSGILYIYPSISSELLTEQQTAELPNGREEWRSFRRSNNVSADKVRASKKALEAKIKKEGNLKDAGLQRWEELGPNDEGGRVRALAVHPTDPDIIYTAGVSGGIYKSTDQGANWTALTNFLPSPSVTCIIIHPTMPDTLYASTGESFTGGDGRVANGTPGDGIFRSFNGGNTWELLPSIDDNNIDRFYWTNKIAFDIDDPSKFYAVSNGNAKSTPIGGCAELHLFSDYGNSVAEVTNFPCLSSRLTTIVINPNDGDNICVGTTTGLVVSQNKGATWTTMNTAVTGWPSVTGRVEVGFTDDNSNVIYALCEGAALNGQLLRSSNKGTSWTSINSALTIFQPNATANNGWYHNTIWVSPSDDQDIIVGGVNLWRSTNGGTSFTQISNQSFNNDGLSAHADHHIIVPASDYSNSNRKLYFGNDGGVASTDDWQTVTTNTGWDLLNENLGITQYYDSDIFGNNPNNLIGGSQDNGTIASDDSGDTWEVVFGGDGGFCAISKQDPSLRYASTQNGNFKVSCPLAPFNGDFISYFEITDFETNPQFIQPMEIFPNDGEQILVGGAQLYHLTFNATTCAPTMVLQNPQTPPVGGGKQITAIEIRENGNQVYVGTEDGEIFKGNTTTATWTWNSVYVDPGARTVVDIAISPVNANKVAACFGGYSADNVVITNNGGTSWQTKTNGLPIIHINDLVWHPVASNWLYAGTDLGVMATEDNGNNWNTSPNWFGVADGPGFVEVTKLQFTRENTLGGHKLVATTFGRGFWKSESFVRKNIYLDENTTSVVNNGFQASPYQVIESAEDIQAHGQCWHFDGGTYPVDNSGGKKIVITKRLGKINKTGTGSIIIGEN